MRILNAALLSTLALALPSSANPRIEPPAPSKEVVSQSPQEAPAEKSPAPRTPSRGQLLYENHCTTCHQSLVHIRTRPLAKTREELRKQVAHWAAYAKLRWSREEIEDVVQHLDTLYYKFDGRP
jgi:cytochrome c5